MAVKQIRVCDGCGKELKEKKEIYHLSLQTDRYLHVVDMDYDVINLDFCEDCARNIESSLEKIANKPNS
jgi:hypothetical protein